MTTNENPSAITPISNPKHRNMPDHRRCSAHKKTGERCQNPARLGTNVCPKHGGNAPQVVAKAKVTMQMASQDAAKFLVGLFADPNAPYADRVRAARDLLDRAGLSPQQALAITHELKPYEQTLQRIERGPRPRPDDPDVIDAEIVEEEGGGCRGCGVDFSEWPEPPGGYPALCKECRVDAPLDRPSTGPRPPSSDGAESSGPVPEAGLGYSGEAPGYSGPAREEARSGPLPGRGYPSPDEGRQARTRPAGDPGDAPGASEYGGPGYVTAEEGARQAAQAYRSQRRPRPPRRRV